MSCFCLVCACIRCLQLHQLPSWILFHLNRCTKKCHYYFCSWADHQRLVSLCISLLPLVSNSPKSAIISHAFDSPSCLLKHLSSFLPALLYSLYSPSQFISTQSHMLNCDELSPCLSIVSKSTEWQISNLENLELLVVWGTTSLVSQAAIRHSSAASVQQGHIQLDQVCVHSHYRYGRPSFQPECVLLDATMSLRICPKIFG